MCLTNSKKYSSYRQSTIIEVPVDVNVFSKLRRIKYPLIFITNNINDERTKDKKHYNCFTLTD